MRLRRALSLILWVLLSKSGSANMKHWSLMRELSLHNYSLVELGHNRTYRGWHRWNCSHEAFFPHACKDSQPLWRS